MVRHRAQLFQLAMECRKCKELNQYWALLQFKKMNSKCAEQFHFRIEIESNYATATRIFEAQASTSAAKWLLNCSSENAIYMHVDKEIDELSKSNELWYVKIEAQPYVFRVCMKAEKWVLCDCWARVRERRDFIATITYTHACKAKDALLLPEEPESVTRDTAAK